MFTGRRSIVVRCVLAALMTAVVTAAILVPLRPSAAEASTGCPAVLVIGARGSGEMDEPATKGMGPEVFAFYSSLQTALGLKMTSLSMPVTYTAADVKILKPTAAEVAAALAAIGDPAAIAVVLAEYKHSHVDQFLASISDGVQSAQDELTTEARLCPKTRFVMAGYS